jgi:uncharacterized protein YerC
MNPSNKIYQYLIDKLSDNEINLILQSPDNIPIIIAGRVFYTIEKQTKKGIYAIHRIRHKGQKIFRRTN